MLVLLEVVGVVQVFEISIEQNYVVLDEVVCEHVALAAADLHFNQFYLAHNVPQKLYLLLLQPQHLLLLREILLLVRNADGRHSQMVLFHVGLFGHQLVGHSHFALLQPPAHKLVLVEDLGLHAGTWEVFGEDRVLADLVEVYAFLVVDCEYLFEEVFHGFSAVCCDFAVGGTNSLIVAEVLCLFGEFLVLHLDGPVWVDF